jgi:uncharacterized protein (DUF2461 family)
LNKLNHQLLAKNFGNSKKCTFRINKSVVFTKAKVPISTLKGAFLEHR